MTGLLICAAVLAFLALWVSQAAGMLLGRRDYTPAWMGTGADLAWRAGGAA